MRNFDWSRIQPPTRSITSRDRARGRMGTRLLKHNLYTARAQRAQIIEAKMKRRAYLFIVVLFSTIPGLLARSSGAPTEACSDLLPRHGAASQPSNGGYFILSEAIDNGYTPGRQYLGILLYAICFDYTCAVNFSGTQS